VSEITKIEMRDAQMSRPATRFVSLAWAGVVPFFAFALFFLLLPSAYLFIEALQDAQGHFTLGNIVGLLSPTILNYYLLSIEISAATALGGGLLGFMLAYAVILGGLPRFVRTALMTFSGVASNFAGVPLAFSFIATLGRQGFVTLFLRNVLNINIYVDAGFNLYSFAGLSFTYMYFQFPLMVLIIAPALDGLKREWREASENLGASSWEYWRYVALPVLTPALLGTMILLFGNAFGAYATAYALTGGALQLVTIQIGAQITGDVLNNENLGYAMAVGMVIVMAFSLVLYSWLEHRSQRWLQ
jgi:putative spermidine/putrescine transport system permease protein